MNVELRGFDTTPLIPQEQRERSQSWLGSLSGRVIAWLDSEDPERKTYEGMIDAWLKVEKPEAVTTIKTRFLNVYDGTEFLILSAFKLKTLPDIFGFFAVRTHLLRIDVSINELTILPPSITYLPYLFELQAHENKLVELPVNIGNLNLRVFTLHNNMLKTLPKSITELSEWQCVELCSNQLEALPEDFGRLNIWSLDIRNNKLTKIPANISSQINLQRIYAGNNKLTGLPKEIGDLFGLKIVNIDHNHLESVPATLGRLQGLVRLVVIGNLNLKELPEELKSCKKLTMLAVDKPLNGRKVEILAACKNNSRGIAPFERVF